MNNTISVYELLGLIKDGKAPKRILFDETEYYLLPVGCYVRELNGITTTINSDYNIFLCLNDKVEILEEDKPIIEKIKKHEFEENGITISEQPSIIEIADKLNQVIDYINRKENK